jgi:hypothetical protein
VLWSPPEIYQGTKPVVLAIGGMFSPVEDLKNLPAIVARLADACVVRMPAASAPTLKGPGVAAVAEALEETLETVFAGRPVMLFGVSIGATATLGVRAANLARVLAIEPVLETGALWPIVEPLRSVLAKTEPGAVRDSIFARFGVDMAAHEGRDYTALLDDLPCPVDVVLGDVPLMPARPTDRFPSLVGEPERRRLAQAPNVRLHLAPGAGHNVLGQSSKVAQAVLMEAVRRLAAKGALTDRAADEPLLDATPLTARRVLYWGPQGETFRHAFQTPNPRAEVVAAGDDLAAAPDRPDFDAVVAAAPPTPAQLAELGRRLRAGGHLVARWGEGRDAVAAALAPHGLFLREPVDQAGTGVLRAQKCAQGQRPAAALNLHTIVYASFMMDIRTRLPARALASDPDLQVVYDEPPVDLPLLPEETPKILVLQRKAQLDPEKLTETLAVTLRAGRLLVLEFDDHPLLISEVLGQPTSERQMLRFGYAHAVQTATPPLVEAFRPFNPEVVCFPNAAFSLAPFPAGERPRRVIYGAVLRGDYGVAVARSLAPAIEQFPDTEFVVVGDRDVYEALPTKAKVFHDYMAYESYLQLFETCAISLTPIAPLPMRETKSDAKFVDASRSGALTIASPTIYDRTLVDGVTGLIARDVADWAPLLAQALGDQALRERIARSAWEYVRDQRMFADQIAQRRAWYLDLWSRRHALNAALLARIPGLRERVGGPA